MEDDGFSPFAGLRVCRWYDVRWKVVDCHPCKSNSVQVEYGEVTVEAGLCCRFMSVQVVKCEVEDGGLSPLLVQSVQVI